MTDQDKSLFLQAMQGVKPLKPRPEHPVSQQADKTHIKKTLRQIRRKQKTPENQWQNHWQNPTIENTNQAVKNFDTLSYFQTGLRSQEIEKLKKGRFPTQAELDLHGQTEQQAERQIINFIEQCFSYQMRYIRIIHGKGYNSEQAYPVLKNLVNQLLQGHPAILGFHSAPLKQGGTGAVNILLKAHQPSP